MEASKRVSVCGTVPKMKHGSTHCICEDEYDLTMRSTPSVVGLDGIKEKERVSSLAEQRRNSTRLRWIKDLMLRWLLQTLSPCVRCCEACVEVARTRSNVQDPYRNEFQR